MNHINIKYKKEKKNPSFALMIMNNHYKNKINLLIWYEWNTIWEWTWINIGYLMQHEEFYSSIDTFKCFHCKNLGFKSSFLSTEFLTKNNNNNATYYFFFV